MGVNKNDVVFGWDNEFPAREVYVPEFSIDSTNVTVGEFLEFVMSGEYENEKYWRPDHYTWKQKENLHYPVFWKRHEDGSFYMQLVFGEEIPITEVQSVLSFSCSHNLFGYVPIGTIVASKCEPC